MLQTLAQYNSLWLTLHLFAMVLGLGGATYSDILLIRFLKDLKISHKEAEIIRTMSKAILVGIVLAFISGVMLFIPEQARLLESGKFLAKVVIFSVLVINGFLLHHLVLPKLVHFSFLKDHHFGSGIVTLRHVGFVMGAISLVSWYAVFLLGSFKDVPFSVGQLLTAYGLVLVGAITIALFLERKIRQRVRK